ncbi:MAG TPA: hypothetical protein VFZ64_16060 [Nocardioidaceae bacterium]
MATSAPNRPPTQSEYSGGAVALTATAGILMVMAGIFHAIQGLVALFNDEFFVFGEEYIFKFDVTSWGWIHLIAGTIITLAGIALFQGAVWARTIAVILAGVSIIASFLWMPYYPLWSMVVIAFDVFVIWALTTHGRDITQP